MSGRVVVVRSGEVVDEDDVGPAVVWLVDVGSELVVWAGEESLVDVAASFEPTPPSPHATSTKAITRAVPRNRRICHLLRLCPHHLSVPFRPIVDQVTDLF